MNPEWRSSIASAFHRGAAAGLAIVLMLLLSACGDRLTASRSPTPPPTVSPAVEEPLGRVIPVVPVLQASIPAGSAETPEQITQSIREVAGVAAVARVGLGHVRTESESGRGDVSVVWADPREFRPLAPSVTAQAEFVWRALMRGEVFLAHEESRILAAPSGTRLFMEGPGGLRALRVGGVASNGAPNLGGALVSLGRAATLRLAPPHLILIGKDAGTPLGTLQMQLKKQLPAMKFEVTAAGSGRAFVTGPNAARLFGTFSYQRNADGTIDPDPGWVSKNIVGRSVPILGTVRCHRLLFPQLIGALKEIDQQGLAQSIDTGDFRRVGGCYVPRLIRGENPDRAVSMHAWGLALDINVARNPPGRPPDQDSRTVAAFERWGFRWGGRWVPPDGHHFELAALVKV